MFIERESAELKSLEESLRSLVPAPSALSRDELMFRAGQASAHAGRWRWPAVATLLGLTTALLGIGHVIRPTPEPIVVEKIVQVTVKEPAPPASPPATPREIPSVVPEPVTVAPGDDTLNSAWPSGADVPGLTRSAYLRLRQEVIRWGPEMIPPSTPAGSNRPPLRPADLLRDGFRLD